MQKVSLLHVINSYIEFKKTNKIDPIDEKAEYIEKYVLKNFDLKIKSQHSFICLAMIQDRQTKIIDPFYEKVLARIFI